MSTPTYFALAALIFQVSTLHGASADTACLDCAMEDTAALLQVTKETHVRNEGEDFKVKYEHMKQEYDHMRQENDRMKQEFARMKQDTYIHEKLTSSKSLNRKKASDDVDQAVAELVLAWAATGAVKKGTLDTEQDDDQDKTSIAQNLVKMNGTDRAPASNTAGGPYKLLDMAEYCPLPLAMPGTREECYDAAKILVYDFFQVVNSRKPKGCTNLMLDESYAAVYWNADPVGKYDGKWTRICVDTGVQTHVSELMLWENDDGRNGATKTISHTFHVQPNAEYQIRRVEILRNDLGDEDEYVSSVRVNGHDFGQCHPDGGDFDCTYYDCKFSPYTFWTHSSHLVVAATLTGHSKDCDCNVRTWECSKENTVHGRTPMKAVARLTLVKL